MIRSRILSTGHYLPEKVLTNYELEKMVDTEHDWIVQRTGIHQRHIAAEGEKTSDMAIAAARQALENAGLEGSDIDGIIVATATPDRNFPSVAVAVQAELKTNQGPCFDISAACSGFVYGLSTADALIRTGQVKRLLLIGAEKFSSIVDWSDRRTCVLFGDGAGAVVLEACEGKGTNDDQGVLTSHLHANGDCQEMLYVDSETRFVNMNGPEVFKFAVNSMSKIVKQTLDAVGMEEKDIDWLIPHQANIRIIEATAKKLGMSMEQVVVTVNKHGNTSAASIPLALHLAVSEGKLNRGDLILFEALGGGFTWSSALVRF